MFVDENIESFYYGNWQVLSSPALRCFKFIITLESIGWIDKTMS